MVNCFMCHAGVVGGHRAAEVPAAYRVRELSTGEKYDLCRAHTDKVCREPAIGEVVGEVND